MNTNNAHGRNAPAPWLNAKTAAKAFSVSSATVRRWIDEGCPCIRLSSKTRTQYRFRHDLLEEWLMKRNGIGGAP